MNKRFHEVLQRATQLTRAGRLDEATAAIQQALLRRVAPDAAATATASDADIIDVEAAVVPQAGAGAGMDPDEPTAAAATAQATPSPEARELPAPGSFSAGNFRNGAGQRSYKLYRPRAATQDGRPPALLVMLHGCSQSPDDFAVGTGMNTLAEARGWWVLYPAQSSKANSSGCWNWFKPADQQRGLGEPSVIAGMVESVVQRCGIDPKQVYVAGLSAGGAMAVTLAATHPELFAAVGAHSALPHGSAHDLASALSAMRRGATGHAPVHRMPTIVFHGDRDNTVHPCNGQAVLRQSRAATAGAALAADDTPTEIEHAAVPGGHRYTRSLHRDAQGRIDAEHWLVHGAGHAWSGGHPPGTFTDPRGPDASAAMLRFFEARGRG